jgi:hypothetical protein
MAEDKQVLQNMIDKLEIYCDTWNLQINLEKSKIVVFRKSGRLSGLEKWFYKNEEIEIVSQIVYLGMRFTSGLAISEHLKERECKAKNSINSTWKSFLAKSNISLASKFALFNAVMRSIFCYCAQVWGHQGFKEVDKFQRYFIKRILKLPNFTPTYALEIETGIIELHLFSLELHMKYIMRTLFSYSNGRLPNFLSKEIMKQKIFWFKNWCDNLSGNGFNWAEADFNEINYVNGMKRTLEFLKNQQIQKNYENATLSSHGLYCELNYTLDQPYLVDNFNPRKIMWIFKMRTGMIGLNANHYREGSRRECSLCNLREEENLFHFLGRCPVLREIRFQCFQKINLNRYEAINVLNGIEDPSWNNLYNFAVKAFRYRQELTNEYNL